ncbi:hypothetical protein AAFF_G00212360 [Aldrovandia affinis]|uniref:Uncharacterized protein n=1 Tax=Aldrovandia affinis TaxID=143900 RepID=A0AAD7RHG0_9TELE|nr:hypothetical protein AAFF_G00212360 [Aldrovandia affinis]
MHCSITSASWLPPIVLSRLQYGQSATRGHTTAKIRGYTRRENKVEHLTPDWNPHQRPSRSCSGGHLLPRNVWCSPLRRR